MKDKALKFCEAADTYTSRPGWLHLAVSLAGLSTSIFFTAIATAAAKYGVVSEAKAAIVFIPWLATALAFAGAATKYTIGIFFQSGLDKSEQATEKCTSTPAPDGNGEERNEVPPASSQA